MSLRARLRRLEHAQRGGASTDAPPLTNEQLAELMRQYHANPGSLSIVDRQRCAMLAYVTDPSSSGFRPAIRDALYPAGEAR
jgi:hypothetical protein